MLVTFNPVLSCLNSTVHEIAQETARFQASSFPCSRKLVLCQLDSVPTRPIFPGEEHFNIILQFTGNYTNTWCRMCAARLAHLILLDLATVCEEVFVDSPFVCSFRRGNHKSPPLS